MAVTIVGAGAIGGVTGASLTRAGHDVLLLAMGTPDGKWTAPVRAVTPDGLPATLHLVLLAVKAQHTGAALDRIAPRLHARGTVASLQNGLNEAAIALRVGQARTVGRPLHWGARGVRPG